MRLPDWLPAESDAWQQEGLITPDQRRAILARYTAPASAAEQASSALTWLAVLAAGIGAIVLVAWNWTSIPDVAKVLMTAPPMLALYAASALAARAGRDVRAERLALLAALFAGAVLFVTEDLAHIDPQRTNTTLLWAVVLATTALLTPSALTAAVGTLVLLWWLLATAGDAGAAPWWALAVWPLLALAVERSPNRWIASGVAFAFGFWVFFVALSVWNDQPAAPAVAVVLAGSWLESLARAPASRRPAFARTTPALFVTMLGLIVLLPSATHRTMTDWRMVSASIGPGFALLAGLALGVAWNARSSGGWRSRSALLAALAVVWLLAWVLLPAGARASWWGQWVWTWAFSGAMVLTGASAVREAARTRDLAQFALGLLCVLAFVIVRVVDSQSVVVSGLMLLVSAAALWWLGRMWAGGPRAGARS